MQKKLISEYDNTKRMLNTLRKLNENTYSKKNAINEQSQEQRNSVDGSMNQDDSDESLHMQLKNDITVINGVDVKLLSSDNADMKLTEPQKQSISGLIDNFKSQVSQIVDFKPGMTINEKQIRLDGTISDFDIKFTLIAGDQAGCYLNADMLKLEADVTTVIDKLVKFELTFKQALEPFITQRQNN